MIRWFHESAEIAFLGCQNADVWYMRKICTHEAWCRWNVHFTTAQKRIFRHEKWRKFPHPLRCTLTRWFHESAEIAFSGCQNADDFLIRIIRSHETWYPWYVYFTTEQDAILGLKKLRKFPLIARCLEKLVSLIVRIHIFRMPNSVKFAHTMLVSLEPCVSQIGKNWIF